MSVSPAGVPMPCQWRPGLTAGTPTSGLPAYESVEHDVGVPHLAVRLSRPVLSTDAGVSCAPPAKSYLAGPPRRPWQQSSSPGAAAAVGLNAADGRRECKAIFPLFLTNFDLNLPRTPVTVK